MDPDAALRALRAAHHRFQDAEDVIDSYADASQMAEHWDGLDGWLTRGGFPPAEWADPRAELEAETQARADVRWVDQTGGLL